MKQIISLLEQMQTFKIWNQIETKWKQEYLESRAKKERLIWALNFVKIAAGNTMRRTIWIGAADNIKVNMEVKCGGVVVKSKKMPQVASFQSTKRKGKTRKMMILKIKKKISFVKWN
jgi:hypothetical protein